MFGNMPDEMFDHEPSSFDDAKRGWHEEAMGKMPAEKLIKMLAILGAKSIKEACMGMDKMSKDNYIQVLSMYDDDDDEERGRGMH